MSTLIKLKRSAVAGRVPTTAQLELGELAINTADGKIYIKQDVSGTESIVEFSADPNDLLTLIKTVDGSGSGLDADLLDGIDSTQFLRSDESDTLNGSLIVTGDLTVSGNTTYVIPRPFNYQTTLLLLMLTLLELLQQKMLVLKLNVVMKPMLYCNGMKQTIIGKLLLAEQPEELLQLETQVLETDLMLITRRPRRKLLFKLE